MGFDATHSVVCGTDARRVRTWASKTFCIWLAGKLNDVNGLYAADLQVTPQRQVLVTGNQAVANVFYKGEAQSEDEESQQPSIVACPVVLVMKGPDDMMQSGQTIGGTFYKGARHNLTFALDMGVSDAQPNNDNAVDEEDADSMLADYVLDAVKRGFSELCGIGLNNLDIKPDMEKQRAGQGRNPHTLTCLVVALDNYQPAG